MSDVALYRKYRPQSFEDVIGQEQVTKVLKAAVISGSLAHAYLFSGSRGTGKTSVARILARSVKTSNNDLYEIDAASNRGIDDIRELRDAVLTVPFDSKYKVYIIDEVHMLTKEAFNALLKTLEEPPSHAIFILATTEPEKLPDTVRSRCQSFFFKSPAKNILADVVQDVAKKEGFDIKPDAADLIALLGDGSYRDTLGTLQKVLSATKEKIVTLEEVASVTDAPNITAVDDVVAALHESDLATALMALSEASEKNADMKLFCILILQRIRVAMLLRFAPELKPTFAEQFSGEALQTLSNYASSATSGLQSKTLDRMLRAYEQIGSTVIPQVPLELALIDLMGTTDKP